MKLFRVTTLWAALGAWAGVAAADAALDVVTSLPDLAAVAREVGGDHVRVTSLAHPLEDPHFVDPRPSFIRVLNRADVLVIGGADLEIGWLPPLVRNARNGKILEGGSGRVDASAQVPLMDVPEGPVDRSAGDIHMAGNPHYLLDPENAMIVGRTLASALGRIDPEHAAEYRQNAERFQNQLEGKLKVWVEHLDPYRGSKVVTYHKSYDYLLRRFRLELAGTIEIKPGIEPSPSHVTALIKRAKEAGVRLVLVEPNRSPRTPGFVAQNSGATLLMLPLFPEKEAPGGYAAWMDGVVEALGKAFKTGS